MMKNLTFHERDKAFEAYSEDPTIVHRLCGVTFQLGIQETILLTKILREQEQLCADILDEWPANGMHYDEVHLWQQRIRPQIQISHICLREMRLELETQAALFDGQVVLFQPTRLQVTFLLQAVEWMDVWSNDPHENLVDLEKYRLARKFDTIANQVSFELNFWLATAHIHAISGQS